jgi:hypothetical protein
MKNILMALVCLFTFGTKAVAGNNEPKCCKEKCSKQCVEMCKKNNCTDKDCCALCGSKDCKATACSNDKKAKTSVASTDVKNASGKTEVKTASCCAKK